MQELMNANFDSWTEHVNTKLSVLAMYPTQLQEAMQQIMVMKYQEREPAELLSLRLQSFSAGLVNSCILYK